MSRASYYRISVVGWGETVTNPCTQLECWKFASNTTQNIGLIFTLCQILESIHTVFIQEQLGRERDAVRIKEKQVEDQLETIHRLKQDLAGKEHKLQSSKLEWEREQQSLQLLLEQEEASNNELQVHIIAHT